MAPVSKFGSSDISQLKAFILEAWKLVGASALGWTGATNENIREIASEDFLRGTVENPDLTVFIDKAEEEILGFCALRKINTNLVELAGIVVRQDHIGKGIGSTLFEKAKTAAVESGFTEMSVKTESANEGALSFYKEKGFVEQETVTESLNNEKVSLMVMKLELLKT
jgi:ribosomal protein S18 acetylase RimI-like enzyme